MPLPDESSRPSASSLIKRFEAISASQDSSSASAMNRSVSGGAPKRIWSNPSATTGPATSAVAPSLAVDTRTSISIDTSKPLPEPPTASDEAMPNVEPELASTTLPEARNASSPGAKNPPSPTSQAPAESTTILFSGPSPTTPMRNFPPPIITQSSLDVDGPPVGAVPGSANGLLASSPPHPTSLTELVAGGSKHSKSPSVDSTSTRVSHEGLSQPTSPRVDEQRLSAPPLRGEASPPPCDSEDSPQEKKFTFPAVESKEKEVAAESPATDGSAPIKERLKVKSTSSSTSNARTKSTSPPIRRTVSPTVPIVPKSRPSLTSPTASSLAKSRSSTDKSPPLSPKISPRTTNATLPKTIMTVGGVGAPRSSSSASLISRSGAPSPTPSTASRSSALESTTRSRPSRATTPSTPSRSPPMTRKRTGSGTTTTTSSSTLNTPARNTPRTPSASRPLRSSTPSKFSSRGSSAPISETSPEGKKIPTRVGNVKMASRGGIGLAGAPASANPSPRGAKKVEQRTETPKKTVEDTSTEKEDEVEAPRHEDIPDIPSDEEERVFDPMTLQGGRPAPGRIGIPMDVETGRVVGDEELKAAQG